MVVFPAPLGPRNATNCLLNRQIDGSDCFDRAVTPTDNPVMEAARPSGFW